MDHPFQAPGVELITQEYLAARRQLRSRTNLTPAQHVRREKELAEEHGLRCTQEWKSVLAQMRADQEIRSEPPDGSVLGSTPGAMRLSESGRVELHNEEAWERFLEAERRELEMRKEGHLAKLLGDPLPEESPEELKRLAEDDRLKALEGLVALKTESGEIVYQPLEDLTRQERRMRIRAEGERVDWIVERGKKLQLS